MNMYHSKLEKRIQMNVGCCWQSFFWGSFTDIEWDTDFVALNYNFRWFSEALGAFSGLELKEMLRIEAYWSVKSKSIF